jgi:hypothetical protein
MLFVAIPFAITSALAACVAHSAASDREAVSVVAHGAEGAAGMLGVDAGDTADDDFEDILEQRLSMAELRAFAAPAALGANSACSMRCRLEDGRCEKPPRPAARVALVHG